MSTALGIAAVTATLRDLLNNGMLDRTEDVGDVNVTVLPPDRVWPGGGGDRRNSLNLFLYHVTPNLGYRNAQMPSRDARGDRIANPPLAIDLHYMITAFGVQDFAAEILLGHGMQILHETPVLTRTHIEAALGGGVPTPGDDLPDDVNVLRSADLANQLESIKLTPHNFTLDEVARLWTAFQTPYRTTACYLATVLLIESRRPTRASEPVRERVVATVPLLHPSITAVEPLVVPFSLAPRLTLKGAGLRGAGTEILVGELAGSVDSAGSTETSVAVRLPAGLRAGLNQIRVVRRATLPDGTFRRSEASNSAPFAFAPRLRPDGAGLDVDIDVAGSPRAGTIAVRIDPPVGRDQKATLLFTRIGLEPESFAFASPTREGDTDEIEFVVAGLAPGDYLARVEVDGAQSALSFGPDGRATGPLVSLP